MKYSKLGHSNIQVSKICLGTMVFGEQNTDAEARSMLDLAWEMDVNFVDTAEMYSVPSREPTYGASEIIVGNWLQQRRRRDDVVLATKVVGPCADWMPYIRQGKTRLDRRNIRDAVEGSLRRLQTDYIDLYQVHWPERKTNYFGQLGYEHEPEPDLIPIGDTLLTLSQLVDEGKIRAIGVSNETPWGLMQYLTPADGEQLHRIVAIQNPYNLLNRSFEVGLAEMAIREQVGLLAYSPLGFGVLSGKYLDHRVPRRARLTLPQFKRFTRYTNPIPTQATKMYAEVAADHGLSFAQMALAYVNQRPFVTSTIIGVTTPEQLQENINSVEIELPPTVVKAIEAVHKQHPNPSP